MCGLRQLCTSKRLLYAYLVELTTATTNKSAGVSTRHINLTILSPCQWPKQSQKQQQYHSEIIKYKMKIKKKHLMNETTDRKRHKPNDELTHG